jgi:hypothetical protein
MITVEWLESQIETLAVELAGAREREREARNRLSRASEEHGDAVRERAHLAEVIRGLREELDFMRSRGKA